MSRLHVFAEAAMWRFAFVFALLALAAPAPAAETAGRVVTGYLTMTPQPNCPTGPCFVQYGTGSSAPASNVAIVPSQVAQPYAAKTIGISDSTLAATVTNYLDIVNNSASATMCINFGAAATISGTACAAGEITIPPLWHRSWPDGGTLVPTGAIHAIASAASTPASVGAN